MAALAFREIYWLVSFKLVLVFLWWCLIFFFIFIHTLSWAIGICLHYLFKLENYYVLGKNNMLKISLISVYLSILYWHKALLNCDQQSWIYINIFSGYCIHRTLFFVSLTVFTCSWPPFFCSYLTEISLNSKLSSQLVQEEAFTLDCTFYTLWASAYCCCVLSTDLRTFQGESQTYTFTTTSQGFFFIFWETEDCFS